MNTPAQCSLSFVHARDVPRTVILRRGPSRWVRCILWHRDRDTFEDGQWFRGTIRSEDCFLSPDAAHLIYIAHKEDGPGPEVGYRYTVISRPPWLTALALFPGGRWEGFAGRFLDNRRFVLLDERQPEDKQGRAAELERVFEVPKDARNTLGFAQADGQRVNLRAADIEWVQNSWAMPDPMQSYDVEAGRLSRDGKLIRDFGDMTFEPIRAPYDIRQGEGSDPAPEPWHPLDREQS